MEPWITWQVQSLIIEWGQYDSTEELYEAMEQLRKSVKEATDYPWDNSHFKVKNSYGRVTLSVSFTPNQISIWNAQNGRTLGQITDLSEENIRDVEDWVRKVSDGLTRCNECEEWVEEYHTFSFAGAVCNDCYNPDKHKPPRTA